MNAKKFKELTGLTVIEFARQVNIPEHQAYDDVCRRGYCNLINKSNLSRCHPLWDTWSSMKTRCYNTKSNSYPRYGGRGIRVCGRWFYSFDSFVEDMGPRPEGCTLDRIDNDGNYNPVNCRWATTIEQSLNSSTTKCPGLHYCLTRDRWIIRIRKDGKLITTKQFSRLGKAVTYLISRYKELKMGEHQRIVEEYYDKIKLG